MKKDPIVRTFATHRQWTIKETSLFQIEEKKDVEVSNNMYSEGTRETTAIGIKISDKTPIHSRKTSLTERGGRKEIFESSVRSIQERSSFKRKNGSTKHSELIASNYMKQKHVKRKIKPEDFRMYYDYYALVRAKKEGDGIPEEIEVQQKDGRRERREERMSRRGSVEEMEGEFRTLTAAQEVERQALRGTSQKSSPKRQRRRRATSARMHFEVKKKEIEELVKSIKKEDNLQIPKGDYEADDSFSNLKFSDKRTNRKSYFQRINSRSLNIMAGSFWTSKMDQLITKRPDEVVKAGTEKIDYQPVYTQNIDEALRDRIKKKANVILSKHTPDPYSDFIKKNEAKKMERTMNALEEKQIVVDYDRSEGQRVAGSNRYPHAIIKERQTKLQTSAQVSPNNNIKKKNSIERKDLKTGRNTDRNTYDDTRNKYKLGRLESDISQSNAKKGHTKHNSSSHKAGGENSLIPMSPDIKKTDDPERNKDFNNLDQLLKIPTLSDLHNQSSGNNKQNEGGSSSKSNGTNQLNLKSFAVAAHKIIQIAQGEELSDTRRASLQPILPKRMISRRRGVRLSTNDALPTFNYRNIQSFKESQNPNKLAFRKINTGAENTIKKADSPLTPPNMDTRGGPANDNYYRDGFFKKESESQISELFKEPEIIGENPISPIREVIETDIMVMPPSYELIKLVQGIDAVERFLFKYASKMMKVGVFLFQYSKNGHLDLEKYDLPRIEECESMQDIFHPESQDIYYEMTAKR